MLRRQGSWSFVGIVLALIAILAGPSVSSAASQSGGDAALPYSYRQFLASVGGSRYVMVHGQRMHYVESGALNRPTLLLLHGSPDNIYTWRHIMPALVTKYHVIAPDFIGFGRSAHPSMQYTWTAETRYLTAFIAAKQLKHVTLVATDIGGLFGFAYAVEHPQNVTALAFWETVTAPIAGYDILGSYCQACVGFFKVPKDPVLSQQFLIDNADLAAQIYGGPGLVHPLKSAELAGYAHFLATPSERRIVAQIGAQMPIAGDPVVNAWTAATFARFLRTSPIPKLVLYATPGSILPAATAIGLGMPNTQYTAVGTGYHYLTEDQPQAITAAILAWRATIR
ncbi:MAG: hypothetical protein NVS4B8_12220 [Herpetosiphon sp.]